MKLHEISKSNKVLAKLRSNYRWTANVNFTPRYNECIKLIDYYKASTTLLDKSSNQFIQSMKRYKDVLDEFEKDVSEFLEEGFDLQNDPDLESHIEEAKTQLENIRKIRNSHGI